MHSKTQMMKIESPELFYLFRRAFGFFLLFAFSCYYSQMTLIGDVLVVTKEDSSIYVSPETYVHNSESVRKIQANKSANVVTKKKKTVNKYLIASKLQKVKAADQYHYIPGQTKDKLTSTSSLKKAFINNPDHQLKQIIYTEEFNCAIIFPLSLPEIFIERTGRVLYHSSYRLRIRPPPILNLV